LPTTQQTMVTRGWRRFGGAILFVLLAAGCSSPGASGSPAGAASSAGRGSAAGSVAPAASISAAVETRFAAALAPLRKASAYETTVEVDGTAVISATGRSVGQASRSTVKTAGRSIEYIEVPPKAWARSAPGAWVLVAAAQAPVAPLDALARPLSLEAVDPAAGADSAFRATYPAKALGLDGDPLTVTITVKGNTMTFRYEATTGGHRTSSTTTIKPAPADPIKGPGS